MRGAAGFLAMTLLGMTLLAGCGTAPACVPLEGGAPTCGRLLGMVLPVKDSQLGTAVSAQEAGTGRPLDIVHTYHRWYDVFPTASEQGLALAGRTLFINWEPTDQSGRPMSWATIPSGAHDQEIDALANRLRGLPEIFLSFSHEPEKDYGVHGTVDQFAAAYRYIHDRLAADHVTNVKYVWNVMGLEDPVWRARYHVLWPGDQYVDWVAWDPYNWASCKAGHDEKWESFSQIVEPFYQWLETNGYANKPFMLAEYGTVEAPQDPAMKAAWFDAIPAALQRFPNLRALIYFDIAAPPANCNWQLATSPSSVSAFQRLTRTPGLAVSSSASRS
jgi:hypothetical protein